MESRDDKRASRIAKRIFLNFLEFSKFKYTNTKINILDDGCGDGKILENICKLLREKGINFNAYGIDPNQTNIIKENIHYRNGFGEELPYKSSMFDFIISQMVVEHVNDVEKYLKELRRVLTPTGLVSLAAPNNRYFPIEPHFKYPLIMFLPRRIFQLIMNKLAKRNYPINLFTRKSLHYYLVRNRFTYVDVTSKTILREKQGIIKKIVLNTYNMTKYFLPSMNYLLFPQNDSK